MKYRVWECKIAVPFDSDLPDGFDHPPRKAAMEAVEKVTKVLGCFSGWGGTLTDTQKEIVEQSPYKD